MNIRRFFAPDMRQAMRLVREEQGPDAVILSSRRVDDGIEIVAAQGYEEGLSDSVDTREPALDTVTAASLAEARASGWTESASLDEPLLAAEDDGLESLLERVRAAKGQKKPTTTAKPAAPKRKKPGLESLSKALADVAGAETTPASSVGDAQSAVVKGRKVEEAAPGGKAHDSSLAAMQREIEGLRGMLQDQLGSLAWSDLQMREPERAELVRRLKYLQLDVELAQVLVSEIEDVQRLDRAWEDALDLLDARIPTVSETVLDEDGIIALVGPCGVGKTTTIAKLATRHVQRFGRNSVALVTTDAYRIGAYKQLQAYGQILGVPAFLAQTPEELEDILASLEHKQRVFVDTAGMGHRDQRLAGDLAVLQEIKGVRSVLVVAANTQQSVLEETFAAYAPLSPIGLVLTKLDEAVSLGPLLSALIAGQIPALYLSEGQRVLEDLSPAKSAYLVDMTLDLVAPRQERSERFQATGPRVTGRGGFDAVERVAGADTRGAPERDWPDAGAARRYGSERDPAPGRGSAEREWRGRDVLERERSYIEPDNRDQEYRGQAYMERDFVGRGRPRERDFSEPASFPLADGRASKYQRNQRANVRA